MDNWCCSVGRGEYGGGGDATGSDHKHRQQMLQCQELYIPSGQVRATIGAMTLVEWSVRLVEALVPDAECGEAHCCGLYGTLKPEAFRSAIGEVPLSVPTGDAGYGDC